MTTGTNKSTRERAVPTARRGGAALAVRAAAAKLASATKPTAAAWVVPGWLGIAAATAVGGLALFLRLFRLDALGFNSDEAVYGGQAAALAGNPDFVGLFPVFRAHPMLVQALLSPFFRSGDVDVAGRVVIALLGVATVGAVYLLGARLYGRGTGLLAALILAVMPYHVLVTRQVLLDGPMVLLATLTLYCVVRFVESQQLLWFTAAGAMLGLTMLAKETSIVLAASVYAFLALVPAVKRPLRASLLALAVTVGVFSAHPISQALAGHSSTGKNYLVWQLFRRPNHSMWFYFEMVPLAIGLATVAVAIAGLWWRRRERGWRETLLICWLIVPVAFFEAWPVKGFQYLLPIVAPVSVLAARALLAMPAPTSLLRRWVVPRLPALTALLRPSGLLGLRAVAAGIVVVSMLIPTVAAISQHDNTTFLAGSGGVPGGRETGQWLTKNTPAGSVVLTLGPSMANIIAYYGHRRAYGLSVSPNPLHRNPSYQPLPNPDMALRHNELQYVVWDSYSADRSPFFATQLLTLVRRYNGRVVHTESVEGKDSKGKPMQIPVIIVYEVRP